MDIAIHYLTTWKTVAYFLIFIGMYIEGETVLFAISFLVVKGVFNPVLAGLVCFSGVITGDLFWYFVGTKIVGSDNFLLKWADKLSRPFDKQILKRPARMIFISKFTYGLHHALIIKTGMLKIGVKKFLKIDLIASAIWIFIIGAIGFSFVASFHIIKRYLKYAELAFLLILLLMLCSEHILAVISKRELGEGNCNGQNGEEKNS